MIAKLICKLLANTGNEVVIIRLNHILVYLA